MSVDLTSPEFHDPEKAREWLEGSRWPNGPFCSHCGSFNVIRLQGKAHRPGLLHCRDCRGQFTVLTGSVMERSHIPLIKWVLAIRLLTASKKGMSAHQIHRMLNIGYKSAWFMCHRIREAMRDETPVALDEKRRLALPLEGAPHPKQGKPSQVTIEAYRRSAVKLIGYSILFSISVVALLMLSSRHMYVYLVPAAFCAFMSAALVMIRGYVFFNQHRLMPT